MFYEQINSSLYRILQNIESEEKYSNMFLWCCLLPFKKQKQMKKDKKEKSNISAKHTLVTVDEKFSTRY